MNIYIELVAYDDDKHKRIVRLLGAKMEGKRLIAEANFTGWSKAATYLNFWRFNRLVPIKEILNPR